MTRISIGNFPMAFDFHVSDLADTRTREDRVAERARDINKYIRTDCSKLRSSTRLTANDIRLT